MKHQFLLTCVSSHTVDYVRQTLASRLGNFIGDFAPAILDIFPGTDFAPPQPAPPPRTPEAVRKLASQVLLYSGMRPVMVTIYEDHFKMHDEGGELISFERTDPQNGHLASLFRDVANAATALALPATFHLDQVLSNDQLLALSRAEDALAELQAAGLSLLHNGQFDTVAALKAQVKDALGRSKP